MPSLEEITWSLFKEMFQQQFGKENPRQRAKRVLAGLNYELGKKNISNFFCEFKYWAKQLNPSVSEDILLDEI